MTLPGLQSKEDWDKEKLKTYQDISAQAQDLYDGLLDAEAALRTLQRTQPYLVSTGLAAKILAYNCYPLRKPQPNSNMHTNLAYIEPVVKKHAERVKEICGILLPQRGVPEEEARRLRTRMRWRG